MIGNTKTTGLGASEEKMGNIKTILKKMIKYCIQKKIRQKKPVWNTDNILKLMEEIKKFETKRRTILKQKRRKIQTNSPKYQKRNTESKGIMALQQM